MSQISSRFPEIEPGEPWDEVPLTGSSVWLHQLLKEILSTVIPALVMAFLLTQFVAQTTLVHGQSMEPSLHDEQRLIVEKISYHIDRPRRGDIVVVEVEGSEIPLIKRVIGLPGESLEIRDGRLWIDGRTMTESYLPPIPQTDYGPVLVPPHHIFVMGDNRSNSRDSRALGAIQIDRIIGRAWASYWPPQDVRLVK